MSEENTRKELNIKRPHPNSIYGSPLTDEERRNMNRADTYMMAELMHNAATRGDVYAQYDADMAWEMFNKNK